MEFFPILLFVLVILAFATIITCLSVALGATGEPKRAAKVQDNFLEGANRHKRVDLKFYHASILFVVLCINCSLLLPWVLDIGETFGDFGNILEFSFFLAVIALGHVLIALPKERDWGQ